MWPYFTVSLKGHIRQVWLYSKIIIEAINEKIKKHFLDNIRLHFQQI
jgi:hypothetical protein